MSNITIAVLDQFHPQIRASIADALPAEWTVQFAEDRTIERQKAVVGDADIVFVMAAPVDASIVGAAKRLRLVQKLGAGVDKIDQRACVERDVAIARLAGGNSIPVAEHTVLLMLACYRRLPLVDRQTRSGAWGKEEARGIHRQLRGKRVGLVGFGAIGREVASILRGFRTETVYFDTVAAAPQVEVRFGARYLPLDELVSASDIVSLHLPLLPETAGLIDAARIGRMKRGAVLINCARGGLVDEKALAEALRRGHLMAAGIDVFSQEPPAGNPLLALEQTVVTPHLAAATVDNFEAVIRRAVANAVGYVDTGRLPECDTVYVPAGRKAVE
jgi:D-3-phosphoglycerate dehydrogenase